MFQLNGTQLIKKQEKEFEFQLPIICCSNKISVPMKGAIRELKMISHESISKASNAIQL
jgi:hypothetical protein